MAKKNSLKKALITSALSMVLCSSMFVGTTYAWFTDSVTSGSNIIQTGTLDVDLVDGAGSSMAGKVIKFVTADNRAQNAILWEPGCTYETEPVYVVNNGNLALKYEVIINGIDGDAKLLEAIEWTALTLTDNDEKVPATLNGTLLEKEAKSGAIILRGHMKEEAGNEYQGKEAGGISISVIATQLTSESDSIDDQYDKDAGYDYGKTNVGPYKLNVLSGGNATYDGETKTYSVAVNTVAQGGWNDAQGNYYAGYTVNVAGYGANATVSFNKPDGTTTVWKLADEERGGFITNGVHQQWTSVGTERAYCYDIDGDGVTDFTVVNDVYDAKVEVANEEQLTKVLGLGKSVVLTADVALTKGVTVADGADVTLDLNGKTLSYTNNVAAANSAVTNNGTLTVTNGTVTYKSTSPTTNNSYATNAITNSGTLTIDGATVINTTDAGASYAIDNAPGSKLVVNSGNIESQKTGIRVQYGTDVTINGGTVLSQNGYAFQIHLLGSGRDTNLTINDGTFTSYRTVDKMALYSYAYGSNTFANTTVTITGGTFNGDVCFGGGNKDAIETVTITGGTFNGDLGRYLANDGWEDIAKPQ